MNDETSPATPEMQDSSHLIAPSGEAKSLQPLLEERVEYLMALAEVWACTYKDWYTDRTKARNDAFVEARNDLESTLREELGNRTPARQEEPKCPRCGLPQSECDFQGGFPDPEPFDGDPAVAASAPLPVQGQDTDTLRTALERIAKLQHGLEMSATDEDRANYWSRVAQGYRSIAAAALRSSSAPKQGD